MKKQTPKTPRPAKVRDWRIVLMQAEAQRGITPLELLLATMREYWDGAERFRAAAETALLMGDTDLALDYYERQLVEMDRAQQVAVSAAPYMHPRLSVVKNNLDAKTEVIVKQFVTPYSDGADNPTGK